MTKKVLLLTTMGISLFLGVGCNTNSSEFEDLKKEYGSLENELQTSKETIENLESQVKEAKLFLDLDGESKKNIEEQIRVENRKISEQKRIEIAKNYQEKQSIENNQLTNNIENNIEETQDVNTEGIKQIVDSIINKEVGNTVKNTKVDSIRVNENAGTDKDDDVIVLIDLSWSTKNLEKTTREILKMYSDHIATKLASSLADESELAFFWDANYSGLSIKHSYQIKSGNAYKQ